MTNKVCVLGAGSTKYGKLNESIIEIALGAAKDAIESAGITPKEIQAGYISNVFGVADKQVHMAPVIMSNLGISHVPGLTIESACGSGSVMFREAYANVAAGFYDCVLALGVEKVTHTGTAHSTTLFSYCSDFFYEGGNGASFPGLFASMARAYMTTHKATEEDLAHVAVKNHDNGILNPKAHVRKKITVDDVLKSPVVASPLKLLDCCPFSDGASAVILCSEDFARKSGKPYMEIIGSGRGASPAAVQAREDITTIPSTVAAARQAYKMAGITAKDIVLAIIGKIGTAGGTGHAIEFAGEAIRELSVEGRMTVCNMAIEAGARAGMIAVDDKTIEYFRGRPYAPKDDMWDKAVSAWRGMTSDAEAKFDKDVLLQAVDIKPQVTWGTSPEMVVPVDGAVPDPDKESDSIKRGSMQRALQYMGLKAGVPMRDIALDKIFIGSCTNSRIEDLRAAAAVVKGKKVASNIKLALVVPGSGLVKTQAEKEGLDKIFRAAGFEWREPGCSMCLAMNADRLEPGERCASTSNRNFEGRQGAGGRSHLVSPAMAAAAAIAGRFVDVRELK